MDINLLINFAYIISALFFITGLKMLTSLTRARQGNIISGIGMFIAIVVTLLDRGIVDYKWILIGIVIGTVIGTVVARLVEMTKMPEVVAVFNGLGGLSSMLVAWAALYPELKTLSINTVNQPITIQSSLLMATIVLTIFIGGITFTGSLVAYGKLSEVIPGKALLFSGQRFINGVLVLAIIFFSFRFSLEPSLNSVDFAVVLLFSLLLGIMMVIPIGGADMPVVISFLNSYSGLAACAAGFVLNNNLLIVAGSLVGASGIILTNIMCKAMNRSLRNVLFSGFGSNKQSSQNIKGEVNPVNTEDAYLMLEAASRVVIVPGYGMAVAQAQHVLEELMAFLEENDCEVQFAMHPVAGRMPGHMNVLLAEADVPYEKLVEIDDINQQIPSIDISLIIGANDIVNPAANTDKGSPIYGMPIINVQESGTVIVFKRSMASGFSGLDNILFYGENTRMLFGDAKESLIDLVAKFKT